MRHGNNKRKFGRVKNQRNALLHSLALNLIGREKVKTSEAKAKELRIVAEKMITRAKDNTVANRKILAKELSPVTIKKLFNDIAPLYAARAGGYTRIIKMGPRKSDSARMAIIELIK